MITEPDTAADTMTAPSDSPEIASDDEPDFVGIDPVEMATTLRVLASLSDIDPEDPDFVTVRQATAKMFKSVKMARRGEKRAAIKDADREVIAATATGAPTRIDDETRGAQLSLGTTAASAGELLVPRACYICKQKYTLDRATKVMTSEICEMSGGKLAVKTATTTITGPRPSATSPSRGVRELMSCAAATPLRRRRWRPGRATHGARPGRAARPAALDPVTAPAPGAPRAARRPRT